MAAISNFQLSVIVQTLKLSLSSATILQRTVPTDYFTGELALLLVKTSGRSVLFVPPEGTSEK